MEKSKIAFHGVPRSGTSWLGAIFDSSSNVNYRNQPLFSYAFKSFLTNNSSKEEINNFFQLLDKSNDKFLLQKEGKKKGYIPIFFKTNITHIIYKEARYHHILKNMMQKDSSLLVIGIVRNPKSVISSWHHAPKEFKINEWNILEEWENANLKNQNREEEFYGYNKWKEATTLFLKLKQQYPNRFYLVEYKDLLQYTEKTTKNIFDFCNIDYTTQTKKFISLSKSKDLSENAYSVYRTKKEDNKWEKYLPIEISEAIDKDLRGTELEKFLY